MQRKAGVIRKRGANALQYCVALVIKIKSVAQEGKPVTDQPRHARHQPLQIAQMSSLPLIY